MNTTSEATEINKGTLSVTHTTGPHHCPTLQSYGGWLAGEGFCFCELRQSKQERRFVRRKEHEGEFVTLDRYEKTEMQRTAPRGSLGYGA
jgi:hypothetical protein